MAKNITLMGASYSNVPAVQLPQTGGGTARFDDASVTTATASDVASGKVFLAADGTITTGTNSGGGGATSWGTIVGDINEQEDLIDILNEKANLNDIPTKTSDLTNDSGFITSVPVASVNSKTGNVVLDASDVGALSDATVIPTKTSELQNDSGFITSVPVTSVNNKTGAVNLSASDVGALASNTAYVSTVNGSSGAVTISVPTKTSDLQNDSGFLTSAVTTFNGQSGAVTYSAPVSSVNGQTGAVTGLQTTANLVTSVSSSSTDSQYPSAKCLYDLVGDIETLLASI